MDLNCNQSFSTDMASEPLGSRRFAVQLDPPFKKLRDQSTALKRAGASDVTVLEQRWLFERGWRLKKAETSSVIPFGKTYFLSRFEDSASSYLGASRALSLVCLMSHPSCHEFVSVFGQLRRSLFTAIQYIEA